VVRDKAKFSFAGGVFSYEKGVEDGEWCDWWLYDQLVYPFPKLSAAVGFPDLDVTPTTFDEIRPGCWIQKDRLADMDANHVDASICFPNTLPRFCGQTFYEQGVKREGGDPELALLCVQAYNDWMIDEWCAGDGKGRLIPLTMIPVGDAHLRPTRGTGPRSSPPARRRGRWSACTSARRRACRPPRRTRRSSCRRR